MSEKCGDCRFWNPENRDCRRKPPKQPRGEPTGWGIWPRTDRLDWCGEFKPKEGK